MGKNNSYTASSRLKVISFAEQFGHRAAQREFGILESKVRYWRKQKIIIKKKQKVTVWHFLVRKLENPHILRTPNFQRLN
jgi:hypothetical protein